MNLITERGDGPFILDFLDNGDTLVHIVGTNHREMQMIRFLWSDARDAYDKYMEYAKDGVDFTGKLLVIEAKPKNKVNVAFLFWYKNPSEVEIPYLDVDAGPLENAFDKLFEYAKDKKKNLHLTRMPYLDMAWDEIVSLLTTAADNTHWEETFFIHPERTGA